MRAYELLPWFRPCYYLRWRVYCLQTKFVKNSETKDQCMVEIYVKVFTQVEWQLDLRLSDWRLLCQFRTLYGLTMIRNLMSKNQSKFIKCDLLISLKLVVYTQRTELLKFEKKTFTFFFYVYGKGMRWFNSESVSFGNLFYKLFHFVKVDSNPVAQFVENKSNNYTFIF